MRMLMRMLMRQAIPTDVEVEEADAAELHVKEVGQHSSSNTN